jgi:hypothetical protein
VRKIWQWLDGRKRMIGAVAGVLTTWLAAEQIINQNTAVMIAALLTLWTGAAMIHAGVKGDL